MTVKYARLYFDARAELGLSIEEYLVAEVVSVLARRTGWCYASTEYLAKTLGYPQSRLEHVVDELVARSLLERHKHQRRLLRPTSVWAGTVERVKTSR